jgi:hypothetical protein
MAVGAGLTPDQRRLLLQALIQGGNSGMTDPAAALQGLLQAPGGMSAAQAIVAGLRNRILPPSPSGVAAPSPAIQASRGSSPDEPTYAKTDATGILAEPPKPSPPKTDDVAAMAKKLSDKAPEPPSKAAGGVLAMGPSQGPDPGLVDVPDVPDAGSAVRSAVSGNLRAAARRGQGAMPSERQGPIAITDTIEKAALRHGVDPVGLIKTAGIESHFDPKAKNPNSSAGGLFQFIDSTAKSYGLRDKYDAAQASDAAARLWKDNRDTLAQSLGRQPTNGELYLAHQQGPAGALKIIKNPDATVSSTVGKSAAGLNAGAGLTNRQFADMWTRRMGGPAPPSQPETRETLGRDLSGQTTPPDATGPAASAVSAAGKPIFDDLTPQDQTDLGGVGTAGPTPEADLGPDFTDSGGGDIGGLLGGLSDLGGGEGEADSQSQFSQDVAQEDKQPDKPILPAEDTKPGGILSDGGPLGEPDHSRVDLSRVFSPQGMGGTGLFGRDQGPDPSGFKAPVGLPTGGPSAAPLPTAGILGAPASGLAGITPPQLRSVAPSPPLPPPRPPGIDVNLGTPPQSLAPPDVQPGFSLPRRAGQPDAFGGGIPQPRPATGILGSQPGPQLGAIGSPPAVDPDRFARDPLSPISPGLLGPSLPGPSLTGPGMGGANPPWQDPPKPQGILGPSSPASPLATPDDTFSRVSKNLGSLSGILGQASDQMGARKRLSSSPPSPSLISQASLLNGGLLSNARQGIDLNRFFGLLSGRVG